jgi:YidC/Oxa1 family membrane protein insertase
MVYRPRAFDYYDTIFCAGPHHLQELRAQEAHYQLPPKHLVEHGYGRLDTILAQCESHPHASDPNHVLIAPSWGKQGLIETVGDQVVSQLLAHQYRVTLRPHPQTMKFAKNKLQQIYKQHKNNPLFTLETNVGSVASLYQSAIMISDWSGAALDYAFGLEKPVLFIDVPRKINNPDYLSLRLTPFEVLIRDKIGYIVSLDKINQLAESIHTVITQSDWQTRLGQLRNAHTFNVRSSNEVGAQALMELLQ